MENKRLKNKELGKIEFLVPIEYKNLFQDYCGKKYIPVASAMKEVFFKEIERIKEKSK